MKKEEAEESKKINQNGPTIRGKGSILTYFPSEVVFQANLYIDSQLENSEFGVR